MRGDVTAETLAIDGGMPVRATQLPYGRQLVDGDDIAAVVDALRSDWLTTGPRVEEFEHAFADFVGARHAVAVSSGTAALHAAAFASGARAGDEIITSPLTFLASANCAIYVGATPVFADVRDDALTIDPARIAEQITPRTRAVIPVDYAGQPADIAEIVELAARHGAIVIEDAAHSLGALYRGRRVGSLATMTVFSTHPVKHITTGEGGVVTTDDAALAETLRRFRNHGISRDARARSEAGDWYYEMADIGYNYRLTDIQCALGTSQLRKLDGWLARRAQIADQYSRELESLSQLQLPTVLSDRTSAWHLYVVRIREGALQPGRSRRDVFRALRAENIGVNVHYIPVTHQPFYRARGYGRGSCPVADAVYDGLITLPLFPSMTDRDVEDVIAAVRKVMRAYGHA